MDHPLHILPHPGREQLLFSGAPAKCRGVIFEFLFLSWPTFGLSKNPMALFSNGSQLWLPTTTWAAALVLSQHSPPLITVSPQSLSFCSYPFMLFSSQKPQKPSKIHFSNVSLLKKIIRERNTEHLQSSTNACKALVIWLHTYDLYKSLTHSHPVAASASSWSWKDRHVLS